MKEQKEFIGYRYSRSNAHNGFYDHNVEIICCEWLHEGSSKRIWSNTLFDIEFTTSVNPKLMDNGKPYAHEVNGFGFRVSRLAIDEYRTEKALKVLHQFVGIQNKKGLMKALKKIKAVRLEYCSKEWNFYPRKFRAVQELYFQNLKAGFEMKRVA